MFLAEWVIGITPVDISIKKEDKGQIYLSEQPLGYNAKPLGRPKNFDFANKKAGLSLLEFRKNVETIGGASLMTIGSYMLIDALIDEHIDSTTRYSFLGLGTLLFRLGLGLINGASHDKQAIKELKKSG